MTVESLKRWRELLPRLNELADRMSTVVRDVEKAIDGLGVTAKVLVSEGCYLEYRRVDKNFRVAFTEPHGLRTHSTPLLECPPALAGLGMARHDKAWRGFLKG